MGSPKPALLSNASDDQKGIQVVLRVSIFILSAVLLAGCSETISSEDALRRHGYSETYVTGYHDGCLSGERSGGDTFSQRARDETAYDGVYDYRTGWDYGFVTCRDAETRQLTITRAVGAGIAASSVSGSDGIDAQKMLDGMHTSAIQAAGWSSGTGLSQASCLLRNHHMCLHGRADHAGTEAGNKVCFHCVCDPGKAHYSAGLKFVSQRCALTESDRHSAR